MSPYVATVPDADTNESGLQQEVPAFGLMLAHSVMEPDRVGQRTFPTPLEWRAMGRGGGRMHDFTHFAFQRPGEPVPEPSLDYCLAGDGISHRQAELMATPDGIEMRVVGQCKTSVNGELCTEALLQKDDVLRFRGGAVFIVIEQPRIIPVPRLVRSIQKFGEPDEFGQVGECPLMWDFRQRVAVAAIALVHVLIRGETGTGKEATAGAIYALSNRANRIFLPNNAASYPGELIDAELFGHPANYPNPGMPARKGVVREADGGTLFLDEIGELTLGGQARLLRVLQNGEVRVLGEPVPRKVDVRVIGATNRDDSGFRDDFPARFPKILWTPTLRARRADIPLLVRHLALERASGEEDFRDRFIFQGPSGRPEVRISGSVVDYLLRQPFPLNVRGLSQMLRELADNSPGRTIRLPTADGESVRPSSAAPARAANGTPTPRLDPTPIPSTVPSVKEGANGDAVAASEDLSAEQLLAELVSCEWNIAMVARKLKMHRNTVYTLMKRYGIKGRKGG